MTEQQLTSFEHILLGMICAAPSSGYDLKRIFALTPMGIYQPSSGALYPALRRLEQKGLARAQVTSDQAGQSARRRRVYEPTQAGQAAHANWLRTPIDPATVGRDLGLHLMRFVMMEHLLPRDEVLSFLQDLAGRLAAFTAGLEHYAAAADLSDRHPRLALDYGLAVHRASLEWAQDTIKALSAAPVPTS
jgi:PadR family transcriptional regulator, regulatory protein AphA